MVRIQPVISWELIELSGRKKFSVSNFGSGPTLNIRWKLKVEKVMKHITSTSVSIPRPRQDGGGG